MSVVAWSLFGCSLLVLAAFIVVLRRNAYGPARVLAYVEVAVVTTAVAASILAPAWLALVPSLVMGLVAYAMVRVHSELSVDRSLDAETRALLTSAGALQQSVSPQIGEMWAAGSAQSLIASFSDPSVHMLTAWVSAAQRASVPVSELRLIAVSPEAEGRSTLDVLGLTVWVCERSEVPLAAGTRGARNRSERRRRR